MTNNLGLYIHFPFCRKKCLYCDFYSVERLDEKKAYISALKRQLEAFDTEKRVDSIYFGGGTPSLLEPDELDDIMSLISHRFDISGDCEISMESNPNSLDERKLCGYHAAGINRLSIGMQSASDDELKLLGRLHSSIDTEKAVEAARKAGFSNLSLDLIYALPGQTYEKWQSNLEAALRLSPEHISFYCLTLSEEVPLAKENLCYPDEDTQRAMYDGAVSFLTSQGYERYELSNAAKPGFSCRHNEKYWDLSEYYGFGPAAHSYYGGRRFSCSDDLDRYVKTRSFDSMIIKEKKSDEADIIEEYIMLSLRTANGLSFRRLSELGVNEKHFAIIREALDAVTDADYARKTADGYTLTDRALFVENTILVQIMQHIF